MPTKGDPPPNTEDFDPERTLFFSRRKKSVSLLPLIVGCVLVLGSGVLLVWALNQPGHKAAEEANPEASVASKDPYHGRPILPPGSDNLPFSPSTAANNDLVPLRSASQTPPPAVPDDKTKPVLAALPVNATPVPVRRALPVNPTDGSMPPAASAAPANVPAATSTPINLDVNDADNAQVRVEVLRRIDLMPSVTQANKDKLYASVDHARRMGRVLTVLFEKGENTVRSVDVDRLKQQLQTPEITALLDDPTMVFVILGYADQKGSEKINNDISLSRARSVMDALRDKCGVQNVMHSVAMGGSTLFSVNQIEKNRVAEIWAVLP